MSTDIDPQRLKELFAQAAEIAASVPEPMQDAAFNRALDQLMDAQTAVEPDSAKSTRPRAQAKITGRAESEPASSSGEAPATRLIAEINRTAYPEIFSTTHVLDRSLRILRLAEDDFGIEFLSAPEVAQILVEKFRLPTTHQAVRQALGTKPQYVDTKQVRRGSRGRPVLAYRIMAPGTEFLDAGGTTAGTAGPTPGVGKQASRARTKPKTSKRRESTSSEAANTDTAGRGKQSSARSARKKGPKTALGELISEGFFDEPRLIGDARERLRHKKGLVFTLQDLSPALVRLLREGSLDREQNESGQYEYRRP